MQARPTAFLKQPQRWLVAAASLALGCSFEDHPSLGDYAPNMPAPAAAGMDARGVTGGAAAPGTGGTRASTAFVPAADSGANDAPASMVDAADASARPGGDSGTNDSATIDSGTNARSTCTGVYKGDFSCTVIDPPGIGLPMATTPITMTLQPSQNASVSIANADVLFTFQGFIIAGTMSGQLDCATDAFHADIVDGLFASELAPIPIPFSGVVDGSHDRATQSMAGTWSFTGPAGGECSGAWRAELQP